MDRSLASRRPPGPRLGVLLPLAAVPQTLLAIGIALSLRGPATDAGLQPQSSAALPYGLLGVAAVVAVLLLRRRPGPAVVVAGALELAAVVLVPLPPFALLPLAVVVAWSTGRDARWWAAGTVAGVIAVPLTLLFAGDDSAGRSLGTTMLLVLAFGAGAFRRARRLRAEEERRRAADRQRIAVEQERVRIARELHDVLAHSLSSISVQAGVGLHLAADRPEAAVEALTAVRDASRSALDEVRGVLGLLRGDERAPMAPEPGLAALPALIAQVRESGARVDLDDRLPDPLPQSVQLAVFRIVQESLTNARRHAPGAAIAVGLAAEQGEAVVRVRDRLPGARPAEVHAGNGMTGMRERAAQLGGTLETVLHDDGLEVVARLPLPAGTTPA